MAESRKQEESTNKGSQEQESGSNLEELFKGFSSSEDKDSDDKTIDVEGVQKWFKQANISQVTEDEIESTFSEQAGSKNGISVDKFQQMIQKLAKEKKLESNELMDKLTSVKPPGGGGQLGATTDTDQEDTSGSENENASAAVQQDQLKNPRDELKKAGLDPFSKN